MRFIFVFSHLLLLIFLSNSTVGQTLGIDLPKKGLCAHRGAMATHPENTFPAFRAAIDQGAHMIEFDVHLTADKQLVVIHDAEVSRTTNGVGLVSEMTLSALKELDAGSWMDSKFAGTRIPTFAETLAMMPTNIWLNVHLKDAPGLGRLVAEEIIRQDRAHQCFLACKQSSALEAKRVDPNLKICNMDRQNANWDYVHQTVAKGANFIQLKGDISPLYKDFTSFLQSKGVKINYYGTDELEEIAALFSYGVEFPLVDNIVESMKASTVLGIVPVDPIFSK